MNPGTELVMHTEVVDEYLGFEIRSTDEETWYAVPKQWNGDAALIAQSMPAIRKRIWCWWHRV